MNIFNLVSFVDLDEPDFPHLGIHFRHEDGTEEWVMCLCCGGTNEMEDIKIIRTYEGTPEGYIEKLMSKN